MDKTYLYPFHACRQIERECAMPEQTMTQPNKSITGVISEDGKRLRDIFAGCGDIAFHDFRNVDSVALLCIYCPGLCDTQRLERQVLATLTGRRRDYGDPDGVA